MRRPDKRGLRGHETAGQKGGSPPSSTPSSLFTPRMHVIIPLLSLNGLTALPSDSPHAAGEPHHPSHCVSTIQKCSHLVHVSV